MERITETMDMHTTRRARGMVGSQEVEIADTVVRGLAIRVRKSTATWCLRGRLGPRQSIWTIGPVGGEKPIPLTDARRWAAQAKDMLRNGHDPAEWLQEQVTGGPVVRTFDPSKDGWDWETAREEFLAFVKAERAPATHDDYRKVLNGKDLERWDGKLVKSITKSDVQALQTDIYSRGVRTQAANTIRVVKSCLSWVASTGKAGIEESPASAVRPLKRAATAKRGRVPTPDEIGKLPWLLDASRLSTSQRSAALLVLLTAQRRESVMSACVEDFVDDDQYGLVWRVEHTKRKRSPDDPGHALPLPPAAAAVARAAIAAVGTRSGWVFPQTRLRRAGDTGDQHMASQTPEKAMKKAGGTFNPHDVRRAFPEAVEEGLGFTRSEVKLILDHAEGQSGDVTKKHYALHAQLRAKKPVLDGWNRWVLEQVAAQRPDDTRTLPGVLAKLA